MNRLIAAILEDDRSAAKTLLQADSKLVACPILHEKLYDSGIYHWIYVGDTALHLAAAGYRAEIVELLLASGSDPNAAQNRRRSTPLHYAADGFITGPAWNAARQVRRTTDLTRASSTVRFAKRNPIYSTQYHRPESQQPDFQWCSSHSTSQNSLHVNPLSPSRRSRSI